MQQPLSHHKVFESDKVDEIRERMSSLYNDSAVDFSPMTGQRRLSQEMFVVPLGGIKLTAFKWLLGVECIAPHLDGLYDFSVPLHGAGEVTLGNETVNCDQASGVVLSPTRPMHIRLGSRNIVLNVTVPQSLVEAQLRAITGQEVNEPLEFEAALRCTLEPLAGVWRLLRFVAVEIDRDTSVLANALVREEYCETILTSLLYTQPNNYWHLLHKEADSLEPRYVRQIEEYLEAHCELPYTARVLAEIAGVSSSALYAAFRKYRSHSPMQFLRNVRLRRVRDALVIAKPDATVKEIAAHWGFNHLGRFGQEYLKRFGEKPSETLRRSK